MNLPKKILFFSVFLLFVFLFTKTAFAAVIPDGGGGSASLYWFKEALKKSEQNLESFVGGKELLPELEEGQLKQKPSGIMPGVVNSMTAMIIGLPLTEEEISAGYLPNTGAVGGVSNLIAAMYANPPASGVQYLADLGRNLGIVTPAYAQAGVGFRGLSPILPIWKAFRNIAYLFFVIIFVVIGFAIMFRVKISPQAVITIQSALPRIIMALILVTFSYAIAGFMIDLIYVAIFLVVSVFKAAGLITADIPAIQSLMTGSMFAISPMFFGNLAKIADTLIDSLFSIFGWVGAVVRVVLEVISLGMWSPTAIGLVQLIIGIAIFFSLFRLFFSLLMSYISILIGVILAPLQIMLDILPGQVGFGSWFRNLSANILVFPAAVFMFIIGAVLMGKPRLYIPAPIVGTVQLPFDVYNPLGIPENVGFYSGKGWVPPLLAFGDAGFMQALIGLGIILMTPKVVDMVKEALKVKPLPYGAAVGEAVGWGAGATLSMATEAIRKTEFAKRREIEKKAKEKEAVEKVLREKHPEWYQK